MRITRSKARLISEITVDQAIDMNTYGLTECGDIVIGANKLKMTDQLLKQDTSARLAVRDVADSAYGGFYVKDLYVSSGLGFQADGNDIAAKNTNANYMIFRARDTDVGIVELARFQGAADPYFQATLPMVLKPAAIPGTLVEGHFGYDSVTDKLWYRDASATKVVGTAQIKTGTFNNSIADGAQAITGVGFQPDAVIIISVVDNQCIGLAIGAITYGFYVVGSTITAAATFLYPYTDVNNHIHGVITSLDADGFTVTWSGLLGTAPARAFSYIAFKG